MLGSLRSRPQDYVVQVKATMGRAEHHGAGLLLTQDGYFITAYHIADDAITGRCLNTDQIKINYDGREYPLDHRVAITYSPAKDLMLAKADLRGPHHKTNIKLGQAAVGDQITLHSKPPGRVYHARGQILDTDYTTRTESGLRQGQMLTSAPSFRGCSGGIYTDSSNAVVGMVCFSGGKDSGGPKSSDIETLIEDAMRKYR